jgi:hypothetical protein
VENRCRRWAAITGGSEGEWKKVVEDGLQLTEAERGRVEDGCRSWAAINRRIQRENGRWA